MGLTENIIIGSTVLVRIRAGTELSKAIDEMTEHASVSLCLKQRLDVMV